MPGEHRIPAMSAPPRQRGNPLTHSHTGVIGLITLSILVLACLLSLPYTLAPSTSEPNAPARYKAGELSAYLLPPVWAPHTDNERVRRIDAASKSFIKANPEASPAGADLSAHLPHPFLGTDMLGRSLFIRCLAGGGVSIAIGIAAALISVTIGTLYGSIAGYAGGRTDAIMMRIVDILYGLPYILLVVLLAVAGDAWLDDYVSQRPARDAYITQQVAAYLEPAGSPTTRAIKQFVAEPSDALASIQAEARAAHPPRELSEGKRKLYEVIILLTAIGGVSWLTMARVIRGQVLSLKNQQFMEAARAIGVPVHRKFLRHLLPNLLGPIIVYATLTVPQAILQESFLSFLGIGVQPPLPSWGNLAADGLSELNPVRIRWWLILFPCLLLATTLLSLNFVGEGLREAFDPKRTRR